MFEPFLALDVVQVACLGIAAVLIGINKTAIPGLGVIPVLLLTMVFETGMSTGLQLGMLAFTDIFAVSYYWRHGDFKILYRLLPWAIVGLGAGSALLRWVIPDDGGTMKRVIGGLVLGLFLFGEARKRFFPAFAPRGQAMAGLFGIMLGVSTQLANAAGPVSSIYFLAMNLPKEKYLGCCAWFFLIVNWIKLPIFVLEGRVTLNSVLLDLYMLPLLFLGAVLGIFILRKLPQKIFENIIHVLVIAAGVKLLFF